MLVDDNTDYTVIEFKSTLYWNTYNYLKLYCIYKERANFIVIVNDIYEALYILIIKYTFYFNIIKFCIIFVFISIL